VISAPATAKEMPAEKFSISAIWGPPGQAPPRLRSRWVWSPVTG